MNIAIPKEELIRTKMLIAMKIYDVIESIDGTFLYSLIPKGRKIVIKGLDFYPCIDEESCELIYIARARSKVYKIIFPEISNHEIDILAKFNNYTKRIDKFNPNLFLYITYAVVGFLIIAYLIYDYIITNV